MADAARIAFVVVTHRTVWSLPQIVIADVLQGNITPPGATQWCRGCFGIRRRSSGRVALVDIHRSAIVSNVMLDFAGSVHVPVTWSLTCLFSHQERGAVAGVQSRDDPCQ